MVNKLVVLHYQACLHICNIQTVRVYAECCRSATFGLKRL